MPQTIRARVETPTPYGQCPNRGDANFKGASLNTKPKCSPSSRNAPVAKVTLKVRKMQRGLLVARKVRLKSIPGRQADPLNFYSTHLRFLYRKQIRNICAEEALFQSIFSKLATDNTRNLQASYSDSSSLYVASG